MPKETKPNFDAMTLNERLFESGQVESWDAATASGNRRELLRILRAVAVANPDRIVAAVLQKRAL